MPVINGQKMACVPCIRGHRSTKCNHVSERVMVPVRKPGRPLSSCPCPPDRPCCCGSVRVAIPRDKKCGCGSPAPQDSVGDESDVPNGNSPIKSPLSATTPSRVPSSFRVGKSNPSQRRGSRKQSVPSVNSVNLERMYPGSINVINSFEGLDMKTMEFAGSNLAHQTPPFGIATGYLPAQPLGLPPQTTDLSYGDPNFASYAIPPQPGQEPLVKLEDTLGMNGTEGKSKASPRGLTINTAPSEPLTNGSSCCQPLPPSPQTSPPFKATSTANGKSCCCKGAKSSESDQMEAISIQQELAIHFQASGCLEGHDYPLPPFNQATIFTYPAQYGSWQLPVSPVMWQQMTAQQHMAVGSQPPPVAESEGNFGTVTHQCSCGPGCQCIGCLAHPFNQNMLAYINNAYDENGVKSPIQAQHNGHINGNGVHRVNGQTATGVTADTKAQNGNADTTPVAHTPSETSEASEEQLSMDDYFFVNMPFDGNVLGEVNFGCTGERELCTCGADCQCEGCTMHNPKPSQPSE